MDLVLDCEIIVRVHACANFCFYSAKSDATSVKNLPEVKEVQLLCCGQLPTVRINL